MTPRVSVVVPAYNNAPYLAQTLDSILAQDYADYELVVADHSSTDATTQVLEPYRSHPKVRVLTPTPAGGGALANWNRVSAQARGPLLKLVCGDDLVAPSLLREQVAALDANPGAVLVACSRGLVDAMGRTVIRDRGLAGLSGRVSGADALRATVRAGTNIFGEPGCVLFRRDLLELEGGWDSTWPYLIDQATYARILRHGDMVALRRPLASFRISAGQWSVRLLGQHAAQSRAFHRWLRESQPGLLTTGDVRLGDARAMAMGVARRVTYFWLRRRMQPA